MSREIPSKSSASPAAFSLLEMLVAMAVLSIMMAFLFNLVAQTIRAWEGGSRQVEAAQAARLGLETMADELQFAFGGSAVAASLTAGGAGKTNIVPFFSANIATTDLGLPSALPRAPASGQIFAVAPVASASNVFHEFGYVSVYATRADSGEGYGTMRGRRYYLLRHAVHATNSGEAGRGDFFYANVPAADGQWLSESDRAVSDVQNATRTPLIPNCYQLKFSYASNNNGVLSFSDQWTAGDRLPAGVLITAKVMDEKTAARIAVLQSNGLTANDVAFTTDPVGRILREGTVEVHRFVPFVNARR